MSLNLDKSTWKRLAFGDVIESITDRVDDPSAAGVDRYVGLEHLDPGVLTVRRWDTPDRVAAQKLRFQPGDVIFGRRRAYQKKVARADFEGICSAHALVLRAKPDLMDPDFLPVFLSSDYFLDRAIAISVGSLSPTVNWRDLKAEEFNIPPLNEQKRIAELLWSVEQHRNSLSSHVYQVRRALDAAISPQLRQPLSRSHSCPTCVPLGEVIEVAHGFAFPGDGFTDDPSLPTVVTPGNFAIGGGWLNAAPKTFRGEVSSDYVLNRGDLIVTMTDLSKQGDTLGYPALVPGGHTYLHNQRIGKVRVLDVQAVIPGYIYWILRSAKYRSHILSTAAGSTVRHTSPSRISAFTVHLPPLDAQADAVDSLEKSEDCLRSVQGEMDALRVFRASLMGAIFGDAS